MESKLHPASELSSTFSPYERELLAQPRGLGVYYANVRTKSSEALRMPT